MATARETEPLILCIDFGLKYIGMCIGKTPYTIRLLPTQKHPISNKQLQSILDCHQPDRLAIGYPLNMDGSYQPMTKHVDSFINRLKKIAKPPIDTVDERLTTYEARRLLGRNSKDWNKLNALAAKIILEQWFYENSKKT